MGIENYTQLYGFNNPVGLPIYIEINVHVCVCVYVLVLFCVRLFTERVKNIKADGKQRKKKGEKK